jgi:carboxypeptidase Taq
MPPVQDLREYLAETEVYREIFDHLRFDQQTIMPDGATQDRSRQIGLMEHQIRTRTADPALGDLVAAVEDSNPDPESDFPAWAIARTARRDHQAARASSIEALSEFQVLGSQAFPAWRDARADGDWKAFIPWMRKLVDINLRMADSVGYPDHPMDALLSLYEPALSWKDTNDLLWSLRHPVIELNDRRQRVLVTDLHADQPVLDRAALFAFVRDLTERIGYDWSRGGLAIAPHPFTSPSGSNDVRFTLRDDVPFDDILKSAVHEIGHALYEQGISPELWHTSAGRGIMPYVHESQSKYWENIVGRTAEFIEFAFTVLRPYLAEVPSGFGPETLYACAVGTPTSLIRTQTDELTFNLHILLRWEIECSLLSGELDVADVPELWNARSLEYFGERVTSDRDGCLQDPHWCHRYMGLFTGYVIGNLVSAQLASSMRAAGIAIEQEARSGDFAPMLAWLRSQVHQYGRTFTLAELVARATGLPLSSESYISHLTGRYGQ